MEERRRNWVAEQGGLPEYIDRIAKHLRRKGMSQSRAIATAINAAKKMCADPDGSNWPGIQDVNMGSRAEACAAVAEWERMRTAAKAASAARRGERRDVAEAALEERTIDVDVIDLDTRGRTIHGYAAVYGARSADLGGFTERIAPGAFRGVLSENPDVRALLNHDANQVLGRTRSGTLRLADDERGLRFELDLPDSPLGENVREAVRRRDLDGASFRFLCGEEAWEGNERTVVAVKELRDCSIATFAAYPDTSIELRTRRDQTPGTPGAKEEGMEEERRERGGLAVEDRSIAPDDASDVEARVIEMIRETAKGESRSLTTTSGDAITPPDLSRYLWDRLAPQSVALRSGVRVIPTDRKTIQWPQVISDPVPEWVAETEVIPATDPAFTTLEADPKKLAARTEFSNEVLDDSEPEAEGVVRRLMQRALALKLDLGFFQGNPTADPDSIRGLKFQPGIQTLGPVGGANGGTIPAGAAGLELITDALGMLEDADVPGPYVIVMRPSVWRQFKLLTDADGRRLLPAGTTEIDGARVYTSNQLAANETAGTSNDTSSIYIYSVEPDTGPALVRRSDVEIQIDRSRLFDRDMSEMRGKTRVDLVLPHPTAVLRITGVRPA